MSDLLKIDVSAHTEKKGQLTYLSWSWAWAEVLKIDPSATWEVVEFNGLPIAILPDSTAMVKVIVTINSHAKSCWLPVMDNRNKAIEGPNAFDINKALMRCLTKAIGMHGLGLYLYSGEDLPEGEEKKEEKKPENKIEKEEFATGMPAAVIADWISSFDSCMGVEELRTQVNDGLKSAKLAKDATAYHAIRTAGEKRKAQLEKAA